MAAEIINLKAWRKSAARAEARARADGNAARFGRSKALKKLEETRAGKARSDLDGHLRHDPGAAPGPEDETPEGRE